MNDFKQRLQKLTTTINDADVILIGGGAGLSAAAGLTYSGDRFENNFAEYVDKYQMGDMYSAGFYPFKTQEAKWAYWSKHISLNRHQPEAAEIYLKLKAIVENKEHFVITTNVDYQFYKAGFSREKIFAPQGDYGKLQCSKPCHLKLYDNKDLVASMIANQQDCLIPKMLIPRCPVCGNTMEVNIRIDGRFVEDQQWQRTGEAYQQFVSSVLNKRVVLLEIGVGYNTPSIIKYPFEQITSQSQHATLVKVNKEQPEISEENKDKTIAFSEDLIDILNAIS